MIKIIPNIINKKEQNLLNKKIQDNNFPWYYYDNVIEGRDNNYKKYKNITETYAWVHSLFLLPNGVNSSYFDDFKIILSEFEKKEKIKIKELLRIRIRKTFYCKGHNLKKYNFPHVDLCNFSNYKSLLYYFEDSDGDTIFFKERYNKRKKFDLTNLTIDKRNTPVKGNAVYFDGDIFHAGNCPVNYNTRTVLNFDFKINESV
jgi:hypothetical protein